MAGGRPSKPLALVQGHVTKKQKEVRAKAEAQMMTGATLLEWSDIKSDPVAHKEYMRLKRLLKAISYDDDLWGTMINTLAKLKSEEASMVVQRDRLFADAETLHDMYLAGEIDYLEYTDRRIKLLDRANTLDGKIMAKRKMTLDISKENVMTIQGALRSIPKKPEEKKESPMQEFLKRQGQG